MNEDDRRSRLRRKLCDSVLSDFLDESTMTHQPSLIIFFINTKIILNDIPTLTCFNIEKYESYVMFDCLYIPYTNNLCLVLAISIKCNINISLSMNYYFHFLSAKYENNHVSKCFVHESKNCEICNDLAIANVRNDYGRRK